MTEEETGEPHYFELIGGIQPTVCLLTDLAKIENSQVAIRILEVSDLRRWG